MKMFFIKKRINICCANSYLNLLLKQKCMGVSTSSNFWNKARNERNNTRYEEETNNLESITSKYESKILYNSVTERRKMKLGYKKTNQRMLKIARYQEKLRDAVASVQPLPLSLKYLSNDREMKTEKPPEEETKTEETFDSEKRVQFPYSLNENVINEDETPDEDSINGAEVDMKEEILQRNKIFNNTKGWMTAYDNFEDDLNNEDEENEINYGSPDPRSKISNVACGGCGALLHCKDTGIPGYIPSEIFKNYKKDGGANLQAMVCQRCYFLNEYNLALQVNVSPDDYPKILSTIRGKKALVVLMVDLLDFPCSIWPGIADILGPKTPIVIVGNKIDLIPNDGKHFFSRIKENLLNHVKLSGFATSNILHIALISAKSGYGVEDLITSLHRLWKHKGDVYLVGCTNVGKSSLFNTLLQSDYCKIQASDLIQRATISQWPGTTLNMLKFPMTRPSPHRLYLRHQRLQQEQHIAMEENKLRKEYLRTSNTAEYATLIGRIGQSYINTNDSVREVMDNFSVRGSPHETGKVVMGIDENNPRYALSRWCFDTPGVIQPDQIIHLLTVDELMDTIPKEIIRPETFCVPQRTSLFIAGLARLDYLQGPGSVRLTVFRSNSLPITICPLEEADTIYKELLGTELFKVPEQGEDRLSKWPGLESAAPFTVTSDNRKLSCNDVVLSSAGWVAINCMTNKEYEFQGWTPEKRGIYVRDCLLPNAVTLRGPRVRFTVAYKTHKFI